MDIDMRIIEVEEVSSTNDELKRLAVAGEPEGYVLVAKRQTGGRGRSGRNFYSPEGGIYMSILLRPKTEGFDATTATAAAAVAVAKAIGKRARIKWVNDILIDDKKVCGILTEAVFGANLKPEFVIVGIGINCYTPDGEFPDEIKSTAGAVFEPGEGDPAQLRKTVLNHFFELCEGGKTQIAREYRERCVTLGKHIEVARGNEVIAGTAIAIGDDFKLLIRTDPGKVTWLCSGEIQS